MNYIVLDMEWNQPVSKDSYPYKKIGDKLKFEIIQIGAVKLADNGGISESFNVFIKPRYYKKLHHRVKDITGIDFGKVEAISFSEAIDVFKEWCGENFCFLIWGNDDIPVLMENLRFMKLSTAWVPKHYNLQYIAARQLGLENRQTSLNTMLEALDIPVDKRLHNALTDAYYTALVAGKLDLDDGILNYSKAKAPIRLVTDYHLVNFGSFKTRTEAVKSDEIRKIKCPICHCDTKVIMSYTRESYEKYVSFVRCKKHGEYMVKLRLKRDEDNRFKANRLIKSCPDNVRAETMEKIKKYRAKLRRRK